MNKLRVAGFSILVLLGSACSKHSEPRQLRPDIVLHRNFHSQILSQDTSLIVYLPPGYFSDRSRRYPVLYMQDGENLFDPSTSFFPGMEWDLDEIADRLIASKDIEPLIIVGIYSNSANRIDDYTLTADPKTHVGGKAELYGCMLVDELKPFIDSRYRTLDGPRNTAIGGASLGAAVSTVVALKYPQVFGKLAICSPAIWQGGWLRFVQDEPHKVNVRIWLSIGTNENQTFRNTAVKLRDTLLSEGWTPDSDFRYSEVNGASHNPLGWRRTAGSMLRFLFEPEANEKEAFVTEPQEGKKSHNLDQTHRSSSSLVVHAMKPDGAFSAEPNFSK
jgi:predicted alpha/beta superfamily hydrolase